MAASSNESACSEDIFSLTDDETSKTLEKITSTRTSESSDISASSNESTCSEEYPSVGVWKIYHPGDLSFKHGIDDDDLHHCFYHSDGAFIDTLIRLPHFHSLANNTISKLCPFSWKDDSIFHAKLHDALLPHVGPKHESHLRSCLLEAIKKQSPVSVRELLDALWSKTISKDSDEVQTIKDFYSDILDRPKQDIDNVSFIKAVIHIGISRHINIVLDLINDPLYMEELDTYSKSKLREWVVSSDLDIDEIPVFRHNDSEFVTLAKDWHDHRKFFTSHICQLHRTQSKSIEDAIVPRILAQMDICSGRCRSDEKVKAVSWLLSEICIALKKEKVTYVPILTGSAAECTQALFIDEFDYVLLTNHVSGPILSEEVKKRFCTVVSKMTDMIHHCRLATKTMEADSRGSFPCIYITWIDEKLRSMPISIDIVIAQPIDFEYTLPHHNFLPVPREQQPDDRNPSKRNLSQDADNNDVPLCTLPCLFSDNYGQPVFSQIENALIRSLPSHVLDGYRLAKAVRILHVIQPIVQNLIDLGVTLDIHTVIRTYNLKTCVFYLTQDYVFDESDTKSNNRWKWAISIYEKLRQFIISGDVKEFFATHKYIFKTATAIQIEIECVHNEKDFTVSLPQFFCCRRRKARLMMVDQILCVLRMSYERYHEKESSQE